MPEIKHQLYYKKKETGKVTKGQVYFDKDIAEAWVKELTDLYGYYNEYWLEEK